MIEINTGIENNSVIGDVVLIAHPYGNNMNLWHNWCNRLALRCVYRRYWAGLLQG